MTLLVAASPCALALGTPASILAGIAQAARNDVLVKGGAHLENLGRLKAMAFDKTGTITHDTQSEQRSVGYAGRGADGLCLRVDLACSGKQATGTRPYASRTGAL